VAFPFMLEDHGSGKPVVLLHGWPEGVAAYSLENVVADVGGILDAPGIETADIVGHDWGAAVAWLTATAHPNRIHRLVVLSVGHPLAPRTLRQREMGW
jgi:pimeloyl-ACP methyl ester carboxylesterase